MHPKTVALFVTNCLQLFTDADIKIHSAEDLEPSKFFFVFVFPRAGQSNIVPRASLAAINSAFEISRLLSAFRFVSFPGHLQT